VVPNTWPYVWRQGLANLFRPANQTVAVVLALALARFCSAPSSWFSTISGAASSSPVGPPAQPAAARYPDRSGAGRGCGVTLAQTAGVRPCPLVPMRIVSVKGRSVQELLADTVRGGKRRAG
jgi:putative ABC transport system permease protein